MWIHVNYWHWEGEVGGGREYITALLEALTKFVNREQTIVSWGGLHPILNIFVLPPCLVSAGCLTDCACVIIVVCLRTCKYKDVQLAPNTHKCTCTWYINLLFALYIFVHTKPGVNNSRYTCQPLYLYTSTCKLVLAYLYTWLMWITRHVAVNHCRLQLHLVVNQ